MNENQDLTEYDEEFSRIFEKVHGEPPKGSNMIALREGLTKIFGALANVEMNISGIASPLEWSAVVARAYLRALDRRTDKAWAFNLGWMSAARFAETYIVGDMPYNPSTEIIANPPSIKERFAQLMKYARLDEEACQVRLPKDTVTNLQKLARAWGCSTTLEAAHRDALLRAIGNLL